LLPGARPAVCERGSASPVIVALIAVVMVLTVALAQVGAGLVAAARASGAADLSALAAAKEDRDLRALGAGSAWSLEQACDVAAQVSRRNGAALTACAHAANSSVVVSVSVPIPGWPTAARASARAGPAWG
jgi:secretion/DNA translocation related TadE-like protein